MKIRFKRRLRNWNKSGVGRWMLHGSKFQFVEVWNGYLEA